MTEERIKKLKESVKEIEKFEIREIIIKEFLTKTIENIDLISEELSKITKRDKRDVLISEVIPVCETSVYLYKNLKKILSPQKTKKPIHLFFKKTIKYYRPYEIVLVISPYNYPFYLSIVPTLNAISAGNCVILKPSEHSKGLKDLLIKFYGNLKISKYIEIVEGDKNSVSDLINTNPDKIFLIGGHEAAKNITLLASSKLIPVSFELGDITSMIINKDVDLNKVMDSLFFFCIF